MMFKALVISACAAVLAISTGSTSQQHKMTKQQQDSLIEKEIRQIESEIFAAIQQKDTKKLEGILAADFVYRNPLAGETAKPAFLAGIKAIPVKINALWSEDMKVNVYGEVAILTGTQKAKTQDATGKEETSATAFTDVFVRRNGRWQLALAYGVELPSVPASK
jgi:ketosteroid isomerase-like protein